MKPDKQKNIELQDNIYIFVNIFLIWSIGSLSLIELSGKSKFERATVAKTNKCYFMGRWLSIK